MPKHTIVATLLVLAMTTLPLAGAGPAAARHTIGFQYDLMTAGEVGQNLNGVAVDFDTPVYGDLFTIAAGDAFVTTTEYGATITQTFFGAGPGVRHDAGPFEVYAHALFGYRRDSGTGAIRGSNSRFDGHFGAGIDYPLSHRYRFRAGTAYGGNTWGSPRAPSKDSSPDAATGTPQNTPRSHHGATQRRAAPRPDHLHEYTNLGYLPPA